MIKNGMIYTLSALMVITNGVFAGEPKSAPDCDTASIMTQAGQVCGIQQSTSTGQIANAYLGIPFAESTAAENRWKAPIPKPSWGDNTYHATEFGPACPQPPVIESKNHPKLALKFPSFQRMERIYIPPQSEDCLSVNVWTPQGVDNQSKLPVMVFIYGGSFTQGASSDPLYDGSYLAANKGVILVSLNYRLGVLGFLATDEIDGNYGFLDQQLALQWVQDNIQNFGGDPEKVLLFGQSAGAMSTSLHLMSAPDSAPLFRAAIMESSFFSLPYKTLVEQKNVGDMYKRSLNCADIACLKVIDYKQLIERQNEFTPEMSQIFPGPKYYIPFSPNVDKQVITRQPIDGEVMGGLPKPTLLGTTKDEMDIMYYGQQFKMGDYTTWMANIFGQKFQTVMDQYPINEQNPSKDNMLYWAGIQTDYFLTCSNRYLSSVYSQAKYSYLFDHEPSFRVWGTNVCYQNGNVCHGSELPFVFHSADKINGQFTAEEEQLSQQVMDYWTNFAKDLDPNGVTPGAGLLNWPQFTNQAKQFMVFNTPALSIANDPNGQMCQFWDGIGYNTLYPWLP